MLILTFVVVVLCAILLIRVVDLLQGIKFTQELENEKIAALRQELDASGKVAHEDLDLIKKRGILIDSRCVQLQSHVYILENQHDHIINKTVAGRK